MLHLLFRSFVACLCLFAFLFHLWSRFFEQMIKMKSWKWQCSGEFIALWGWVQLEMKQSPKTMSNCWLFYALADGYSTELWNFGSCWFHTIHMWPSDLHVVSIHGPSSTCHSTWWYASDDPFKMGLTILTRGWALKYNRNPRLTPDCLADSPEWSTNRRKELGSDPELLQLKAPLGIHRKNWSQIRSQRKWPSYFHQCGNASAVVSERQVSQIKLQNEELLATANQEAMRAEDRLARMGRLYQSRSQSPLAIDPSPVVQW